MRGDEIVETWNPDGTVTITMKEGNQNVVLARAKSVRRAGLKRGGEVDDYPRTGSI